MARPRQPADLVKAKGRTHMSRREYEEKKNGELDVPFTDVCPPDYLTAKQKEEFYEISDKLTALGIFTELDVDALGRYIISRALYLQFTKQLKSILKDKEADMREISAAQMAQDKAFRQCVTSANELCLNVSSRAKLVIPKPPSDDEESLW